MTRQELFDKIETALGQLTNDDLIDAWNEYKRSINDYDNIIYDMSEFDDVMYGKTPTEILDSVADNFSTYDKYFYDDIYGLESFTDIYDIVDTDELIEYIIDNCECFDDMDIQKLLDEYDESEG